METVIDPGAAGWGMRLVPLVALAALAVLAPAAASGDLPDLAVSSFSHAWRLDPGSSYPVTPNNHFSFDVTNLGGADAPATRARFVGSAAGAPGATLQLQADVGPVAAGETRHYDLVLNGLSTGYYCIELDFDGRVAEGDEGNNRACALVGVDLP